MGRRRWGDSGKIAEVYAALENHEAAIRRDLICAGLRLDDGKLTWTDLHAFIYASPPGSAFFNAAEKGWDTNAHLAAAAVDLLMVLAWQNTADAHSKPPRNRPKPIPRPDRDGKPDAAPVMGGVNATVMSVEEFQRRIDERRAARGN